MRRWQRQLARITPLDQIPLEPPYGERELDAWRQVCDPLADAMIADLEKTHPIRDPVDMLAVVRERAATRGGVYRDFLDACDAVPGWVDFERMRAGQRLIASAGPLMGLSLLAGSLVGGYVFVKAAKVTALTGRLGMPGDISRRLVETGALVFHLSRPDEIRPGGRAHETLVRVRLLHGAIRVWMRESGRWRDEWDRPINQEDLAITFSEFSYLNVRSLLRMGLDLSREEIDAHFHLWRYAGHVLGIHPDLLPETFEDEVRQFLPMLRHQARPDEGPREARIILDEIADKVPLVSSAVSRRFFHQVTAYLVGGELVRGLGIERDRRYPGLELLRTAGRAWSLTHKRLPGGEAVLHWLGQRQFDGLLAGARREKPIAYQVRVHSREALRRAYGLAS